MIENPNTAKYNSILISLPQKSQLDKKILKYTKQQLKSNPHRGLLTTVTEQLRISAPDIPFTKQELDTFFLLFYNQIPNIPSLENFVIYRIPALLDNKTLMHSIIKKLIKEIERNTKHSTEYFKEIISIFVDEQGVDDMIITMLMRSKSDSFNSLLNSLPKPVIWRYMQQLSDDEFVSYMHKVDKIELRSIKNRKLRIKFLKKLRYTDDLEFLIEEYFHDKESKILCLKLIEKGLQERWITFNGEENTAVISDIFLERLINDSEEVVRLYGIEWGANQIDISDRILDISFKVREKMFKIFKTYFLNDKNYLLKMFKGCLTEFRDEYINNIPKLDIETIWNLKDEPGVEEWMNYGDRIITLSSYKTLSKEKYLFYIKNTTIKLSKEEIFELMEMDIKTAIIKLNQHFDEYNKKEYLIKLLEKLNAIETLEFLEKCNLDFIKLDNNYNIVISDLMIQKLDANTICLLYSLVTSSEQAKKVFHHLPKEENTFGLNYFICKFYSILGDENIHYIADFKGSVEEIIILNLKANSLNLLTLYVPKLLLCEFDKKVIPRIVKGRTMVSSLMYFMMTGKVSITNPTFLITSISIISRGAQKNENILKKIRIVYSTYLKSIKNSSIFYEIANKLKGMSLYPETNYKIIKNQIDINSIPVPDYIMYFICDIITNICTFEINNGNEDYLKNHNEFIPLEEKYYNLIREIKFIM
ncbi:hypothetical protein TCON_2660 [Astathelohania contejeani]|uniref:Uncharacterized protein n=1 Tax=Astathelohania contejeani TaxID=164912 RepID=A0ABQ7HVH4_9MICR|nr:hypothetical protein TCON_2660 [Thelohania contejeani]